MVKTGLVQYIDKYFAKCILINIGQNDLKFSEKVHLLDFNA